MSCRHVRVTTDTRCMRSVLKVPRFLGLRAVRSPWLLDNGFCPQKILEARMIPCKPYTDPLRESKGYLEPFTVDALLHSAATLIKEEQANSSIACTTSRHQLNWTVMRYGRSIRFPPSRVFRHNARRTHRSLSRQGEIDCMTTRASDHLQNLCRVASEARPDSRILATMMRASQ